MLRCLGAKDRHVDTQHNTALTVHHKTETRWKEDVAKPT